MVASSTPSVLFNNIMDDLFLYACSLQNLQQHTKQRNLPHSFHNTSSINCYQCIQILEHVDLFQTSSTYHNLIFWNSQLLCNYQFFCLSAIQNKIFNLFFFYNCIQHFEDLIHDGNVVNATPTIYLLWYQFQAESIGENRMGAFLIVFKYLP